ncbi:DNA-binding transcription factor RAP1 SCDLUD_003016 [Saccharomycodes ludwigii]|uniref:DNA-binding transcription factor RAP1 n=1 Tax=Saccharomycodes ludwigii TaxID=36035 RepID=UPI001E8590CE|nr:hypothetical protein SCDLUD_003016 [Saccharomycodes ludwigii]KAH3901520.1 hypothetical protein SCDLUD_003016 [Saccharomycodes ludwigii]
MSDDKKIGTIANDSDFDSVHDNSDGYISAPEDITKNNSQIQLHRSNTDNASTPTPDATNITPNETSKQTENLTNINKSLFANISFSIMEKNVGTLQYTQLANTIEKYGGKCSKYSASDSNNREDFDIILADSITDATLDNVNVLKPAFIEKCIETNSIVDMNLFKAEIESIDTELQHESYKSIPDSPPSVNIKKRSISDRQNEERVEEEDNEEENNEEEDVEGTNYADLINQEDNGTVNTHDVNNNNNSNDISNNPIGTTDITDLNFSKRKHIETNSNVAIDTTENNANNKNNNDPSVNDLIAGTSETNNNTSFQSNIKNNSENNSNIQNEKPITAAHNKSQRVYVANNALVASKMNFTPEEDQFILDVVRKNPRKRDTHSLFHEISNYLGAHTGNSIRHRFRTQLSDKLDWVYETDESGDLIKDANGQYIKTNVKPPGLKKNYTAEEDYNLCIAIKKQFYVDLYQVDPDTKEPLATNGTAISNSNDSARKQITLNKFPTIPGTEPDFKSFKVEDRRGPLSRDFFKNFNQIYPQHPPVSWRDRYRKFALKYGVDNYIQYYEECLEKGEIPTPMKNLTSRKERSLRKTQPGNYARTVKPIDNTSAQNFEHLLTQLAKEPVFNQQQHTGNKNNNTDNDTSKQNSNAATAAALAAAAAAIGGRNKKTIEDLAGTHDSIIELIMNPHFTSANQPVSVTTTAATAVAANSLDNIIVTTPSDASDAANKGDLKKVDIILSSQDINDKIKDIKFPSSITEDRKIFTPNFEKFTTSNQFFEQLKFFVKKTLKLTEPEEIVDGMTKELAINSDFAVDVLKAVHGDRILIFFYFLYMFYNGENPPQNIRGIWTEEDNIDVMSQNQAKLQRVIDKHTEPVCIDRIEFLKETLEDSDED